MEFCTPVIKGKPVTWAEWHRYHREKGLKKERREARSVKKTGR